MLNTEERRNLSMYNYFIYDFDGTISDSYPVFTNALLILLEKQNITADYNSIYKDMKVSTGYALRKYGISGEIKKEYRAIQHKLARESQKAFPGAAETLAYAKSKGKKNYIYTHTGKLVYELLENMGLYQYFDFILDGSYGFPRKPAPDALNFLIEKCNIDKSRALMIGDRDIDTDAGKNAGIAGCLFDTGGFCPDCKTDHYIQSLTELKEIIDKT